MTECNPNGKFIYKHGTKYFDMLKKQGWKEGKGLGKNAQGVLAPIKVSVKNNKFGIKGESETIQCDNYVPQHIAKFEDILKKGIESTKQVESDSSDDEDKIISKPRYGRKVRDENDLIIKKGDWNRIFAKTEKKNKTNDVKKETETVTSENKFVSTNVSCVDYFKQKMAQKGFSSLFSVANGSSSTTTTNNDVGDSSSCFKVNGFSDYREEEECEENIKEVEKKQKKRKDKKKKKKSSNVAEEELVEEPVEKKNMEEIVMGRKGKKRKFSCVAEEGSGEEKKGKKKKSKKEEHETVTTADLIETSTLSSVAGYPYLTTEISGNGSKKKQNKTEKEEEKTLENVNILDEGGSDNAEVKKKKKKDKKRKSKQTAEIKSEDNENKENISAVEMNNEVVNDEAIVTSEVCENDKSDRRKSKKKQKNKTEEDEEKTVENINLSKCIPDEGGSDTTEVMKKKKKDKKRKSKQTAEIKCEDNEDKENNCDVEMKTEAVNDEAIVIKMGNRTVCKSKPLKVEQETETTEDLMETSSLNSVAGYPYFKF